METTTRSAPACPWHRLPMQAARYHGARLLINGVIAAALLGLAWLMVPPQHAPLHLWLIRAAISGVFGVLSLLLVILAAYDLGGLVNACFQAWEMRRHPLPEPLARARDMLQAIPLDLRIASPVEALSMVALRLGPRPTVWHISLPGYWSGPVMEFDGHLLTHDGQRFVDSHRRRLPGAWAVSDMEGGLLEGMKIDADFHGQVKPVPQMAAFLDAWVLQNTCPSPARQAPASPRRF